jgi:hypothetical protein
MGLLKKIFGGDREAQSVPAQSSQFQDSEPTTEAGGSKNTPRRELVHVVLRDTVRQHGIPSDWIECRVLSAVSRKGVSGMHVQLIVRDGHERLLSYVPAFQTSFMDGLRKFDPRFADWLMSLSWQFDGIDANNGHQAMPSPGSWGGSAAAGDFVSTQDEEVERDIKALFAIRDAAMQPEPPAPPPPEQKDFEETRPGSAA